MLAVAVPPRIEDSQSSSDKVRTEGSDVTLECHATGSPTPIVTWKRENGESINIDKANNISGRTTKIPFQMNNTWDQQHKKHNTCNVN